MAGQLTVRISDKEWLVSLAEAPWELVQCLGGMLFDMGFEQSINVTTESMLFPLDIAFLSEAMVLTEIYRNIQPGYLVTSTSPARYFLEVNAGELDSVDSGTQVSFEALPFEVNTAAPDLISPMVSFLGFTLMGVFAISLAKNFSKEALGEPKQLRLVESSKSEAGLLNPRRFPKRAGYLNKLGVYDVVQMHDDGDLTVRSHGELYVVTTDGEVFSHELKPYNSLSETTEYVR